MRVIKNWRADVILTRTASTSACPKNVKCYLLSPFLKTRQQTYQLTTSTRTNMGLKRNILITVCGNIGRRTVLFVKNGSWSRSRSFISAICEAARGKGRPGGAGGLASVRPRHHRIISPRRRVARDACLRARSLRYAAGLRRAVTRHVWRDRRCYACVWCFVNFGYCVTCVCDNVYVLKSSVFVSI